MYCNPVWLLGLQKTSPPHNVLVMILDSHWVYYIKLFPSGNLRELQNA